VSSNYGKRHYINRSIPSIWLLREQINTGIEEADSEFMLTTYSLLRSVMNKRQKAALQLKYHTGKPDSSEEET